MKQHTGNAVSLPSTRRWCERFKFKHIRLILAATMRDKRYATDDSISEWNFSVTYFSE